jgi:hypothetical protein
MFDWLINLFKEEVKPKFQVYGIIRPTKVANDNGINDEYNKVIQIFSGSKKIEEISYTPQALKALTEVDKIPVVSEDLFEDSEFQFDEIKGFGEVETKRYG